MNYLGVDTGGTFTDFVLISEKGPMQTLKVLSTPDAPERAILQGISKLGLDKAMAAGELNIVHGSTVATNAALEGKGVRTAYITNRGFRDVLTIARQTRPSLYALDNPPRPAPVPRELCLECGGRVNAQGEVTDELTDADIQRISEQLAELKPEAVAINFLFSFLDESHEARLEAALSKAFPDMFICRSSAVLPEYREYERGIATWLNASLGPLVKRYLLTLSSSTAPCALSIMQSSGGIMRADQAAERAVNLLLSGPAGGLAAAAAITRACGNEALMTFDMGGTSTDVALIDGVIRLTSEGHIGQWPAAVAMVDMHTIGAGGGSVAYADDGNLLHVGPQSAGADPGPACYGRGGKQPTVTDANLVLGRLPASISLGGDFRPDLEAAREAVGQLGRQLGLELTETAQGIISLANEHMARALRVISVEQGHDPKQFRLCSFGGAGGLHLCALARALGMTKAIIPANAGVLSALGMLLAPLQRDFSHAFTTLLSHLDQPALDALIELLKDQAEAEIMTERKTVSAPEAMLQTQVSADLRYEGQSSCLTLPWHDRQTAEQDFHQAHQERYGHVLNRPVELVNIRLQASLPSTQCLPTAEPAGEIPPPTAETQVHGYKHPVPVYQRISMQTGLKLTGPAIITEAVATSFIAADWQATVDSYGNLLLDYLPAAQ